MKEPRLQLAEGRGDIEFGKGLYHNLHYENLVRGLKQSRQDYLRADSVDVRQREAHTQYKLWKSYIEERFKELPAEMQLSDSIKQNLMQVYQAHKDRKENVLMPDKVVNMHFDYASLFQFNPVIDTNYLESMVHPSKGYLSHYASGVSFPQLWRMYEVMTVATFEKLVGQVRPPKYRVCWATKSRAVPSGLSSTRKSRAGSTS